MAAKGDIGVSTDLTASVPLLYTYRRCPYAIRARMALLQAAVNFAAHEITLRSKPVDMLTASPKGTVPVLVLTDGRVIDESLDIMRWAFQGADHGGWWRRTDRPDNLGLIDVNDGPFKHHLDRYKYPDRTENADAVFHRDQATDCLLHPLERRLTERPFLGGDGPCAADLAIFPFVRQFRAVAPEWFDALPLPATHQWLQSWLQSEPFSRCMKKLPLGVSPETVWSP